MRSGLTGLLVLAVLAAQATPAAAQRARSGWIGISLEVPVDDAVSDDPWVVIDEVRPGSPAAESGLRPGDRLLSINDLRGGDDFRELPERLRLRVGERVRVRVERDGRRREVVVRAAPRPDDVRSRSFRLEVGTDAMVETMVRAMDSLRIEIMELRRPRDRESSHAPSPVRPAREDRRGVSAPFEFFVFRGEEHDSLRRAMEDLNRATEELRRKERLRLAELARPFSRSEDVAETDEELRVVRAALERMSRESAELRVAMSEAARTSAGFDYVTPGWPSTMPVRTPTAAAGPSQDREPTAVFRPLTPYMIGSNMVAGAQVVDLRPELARYFGVADGVLIVDVAPGTPAAISGMTPGDVITTLDQVSVRSVEDLRFGVSRSVGSLPISLVRQGSTVEVLLRR
jgi:membrane-associated protease RseP (regulator of RpoE activity)